MSTLACKHCGAPIPAETISDGELAICEFCAALNNLSDEPIPLPRKNKAKRTSWIPEKLTYKQHDNGVEIKYHWLAKQHWFLLGFSAFWNGFIFLFVYLMVQDGAFGALIFTSLHVLAGIVMAYATLLGFLNSTTISIRERGLQIRSRPIPSFDHKDKQIHRRAIEQVYVKRRHAGDINDKPFYEFDLYYTVKGKGEAMLVRGVRSHEEALFIEQQIERLYQIENEAVEDEWAGEDAYIIDDILADNKQKNS